MCRAGRGDMLGSTEHINGVYLCSPIFESTSQVYGSRENRSQVVRASTQQRASGCDGMQSSFQDRPPVRDRGPGLISPEDDSGAPGWLALYQEGGTMSTETAVTCISSHMATKDDTTLYGVRSTKHQAKGTISFLPHASAIRRSTFSTLRNSYLCDCRSEVSKHS